MPKTGDNASPELVFRPPSLHAPAMRVRSRIAVAVLVAALLGGLACLALRQQEPMYQGKTLTYWLVYSGAFVMHG